MQKYLTLQHSNWKLEKNIEKKNGQLVEGDGGSSLGLNQESEMSTALHQLCLF